MSKARGRRRGEAASSQDPAVELHGVKPAAKEGCYELLREIRKDSPLFLAYLPLGYLDTLAWSPMWTTVEPLPRASPEVPHVQAELTRGRLKAAC